MYPIPGEAVYVDFRHISNIILTLIFDRVTITSWEMILLVLSTTLGSHSR